jgi:predicted nucleotidyltransferase
VDVLKVFSQAWSKGAVNAVREVAAARLWLVGCIVYRLGMTESEVITEIGRRLAGAVPVGSRVVLFGSRARGEAGVQSDYDLLVIEPSVENVAVESTRLRDELDDLRTPIDVVVVSEDVARRRAVVRGTVVDRALREGRVLVGG